MIKMSKSVQCRNLKAHNEDTTTSSRLFSCYVFNEEGKFFIRRNERRVKSFSGIWPTVVVDIPARGGDDRGCHTKTYAI